MRRSRSLLLPRLCSHSRRVSPKDKSLAPVKHHKRTCAPAHLLASVNRVPQPLRTSANRHPVSRKFSSSLFPSQWSKLTKMPVAERLASMLAFSSYTHGPIIWFMLAQMVKSASQIFSLLSSYLSSGRLRFHLAINLLQQVQINLKTN